MACSNQVRPIVIPEKVVTFNPITGKVKEIFEAKEKSLPEFLSYSSVNCPPGLEFLLPSSQISLQQIEECGACAFFCSCRAFDIYNDKGEKILRTSGGDCCESGFVTTLKQEGQLLLHARRAPICCGFLCGYLCDKGLRVQAPTGNLLGFVANHLDCTCCECKCKCTGCSKCKCTDCCDCNCKCDCCTGWLRKGVVTKPIYFIMDPNREIVMTINIELEYLCWNCLPCLPCDCGCDCECKLSCSCKQVEEIIYTIRANDGQLLGAGTLIGQIRRTRSNCCRYFCQTLPKYDIAWPEDLDVRMKVLLMSAVPLMNYERY